MATRPFFTNIEGLRGAGALAVAAYHFSGWQLHGVALCAQPEWENVGAGQNSLGRFVLALFPGHAALMMFFVISGYVLRLALQFGPQSIVPASWRFLVNRAFRIHPIVVFGTAIFLLVARWYPLGGAANPPLNQLALTKVLANCALLDTSVNSTLWALQVEVLMAPIILLLYFLERRSGPGSILTIALLTTPLSFHGHWAFWPPLSHNFFAFVLGLLIPTVGRALFANMSPGKARACALAALAALFLPGPLLGFYSHYATVIEAYGAVVLVSLASLRPDIRGLGILSNWGLRKVGLISGSFYVLHVATFPFAIVIFGTLIPSPWSANYPALAGMLIVPLWLLAIAPVMWLSYRTIEAPGIALGRRLTRIPSPVALSVPSGLP